MDKARLVVLSMFLLFCVSPAGEARAGASDTEPQRVAGSGWASPHQQIVKNGKTYTICTCSDLLQSARNFDNESIVVRNARILKTDFYDPYRRQLFVSDRTGKYERIFVELYSPLGDELARMEGRTGTLYGAILRKPSAGCFIVNRWEAGRQQKRSPAKPGASR